MPERLRVYAGDCTTTFEGTRSRTQRGFVVVTVKPDNTTLVHDADGYQPIAWLTRPDSVSVEDRPQTDDGFEIVARTDDQLLRIVSHATVDTQSYPVSQAGVPVGTCPDCDGQFVRTGGSIACLECGAEYGLPTGATVTERSCPDCALPTVRVERGEPFQVCVDPSCEPLYERVHERFDGVWDCPDCDGSLGVQRAQGRVFFGCTEYPACDTTFSIPSGIIVDDCPCGFPIFETASGKRCLDSTCERWQAATDGGHRPGDGDSAGPTLEPFTRSDDSTDDRTGDW